MFVQIHMLQSMPPGNLNRDETGQPKKCIFGGVTRGRISSQCLKRNVRHSIQFKEAFGDDLASRTQYLPRMVADALEDNGQFDVPADDLDELMAALAARFHKEERRSPTEEADDDQSDEEKSGGSDAAGAKPGVTAQLVFFPPPFAREIAKHVADLRKRNPKAYNFFLRRKLKPKPPKAEEKSLKQEIDRFVAEASKASQRLTVDIGLFGRMTTSELVLNVEASCQVAHAISTHETIIESDYFTAMDDRKAEYVSTQTGRAAAGFLGSGETETFFNSAVYYKYLNVDTAALRDKKHLPALSVTDAARVAGVLLSAAALATPTGKQNSFAAHSVPELILVEVSKTKRALSYANAFLQPVEGGAGRNLMGESAKALQLYVDSIAAAFAPADVRRVLLAVGPASMELACEHGREDSLDELVEAVVGLIAAPDQPGASA